ncbi:hypothetical protein IAT40_004061 [Kwoniella sp. CBS 6097]
MQPQADRAELSAAEITESSCLEEALASTGEGPHSDSQATAATIRRYFDSADDDEKSALLIRLSTATKNESISQGSAGPVSRTAQQVVRGINRTRNTLMEVWNRYREPVQSSSQGGQTAYVGAVGLEGQAVAATTDTEQASNQPVEDRKFHWAASESKVAQTLDSVMKEDWFTENHRF